MEKQKRKAAGKTLHYVVSKMDSDHQKWLQVIFHFSKYLAADGLPFRVDKECLDLDEELFGGLL